MKIAARDRIGKRVVAVRKQRNACGGLQRSGVIGDRIPGWPPSRKDFSKYGVANYFVSARLARASGAVSRRRRSGARETKPV